jgi:glycosyltransferase involved in cell wall biosynthesis
MTPNTPTSIEAAQIARHQHSGDLFVACTAVFSDESAKARSFASSFRRFHPGATVTILVMDRINDCPTLGDIKPLFLGDVGLDPREEWRLPMLFNRAQLRALIPMVLLAALLERHNGPVAYFSPSTKLFALLSDIIELIGRSEGIVATPPIDNDAGDLGRSFIGAVKAAAPRLRERFDRLRVRMTTDTSDGRQVFQEVFGSLPQQALSLPGFAINYSNLDPQRLHGSGDRYQIDDHPLQSFDFRGYDPHRPHLLSRYLGSEPRILLSEFPLLAALCDDYRKQLLDAGYTPNRSAQRVFELLPSGLHLDTRMRRVYRAAFAAFRSGSTGEPPSPFGPAGEEGFLKWLNEPIDPAGKGVSRYMLAVYEDRPDVKAAYPDPMNRDAADFRHWYFAYGVQELNLPAPLAPQNPISTTAAPPAPVNVAGYFRAELGIGTAARSLIAALETAQIPINTVTFNRTANRLAYPFTERSAARGEVDINIVCINPDQIAAFAQQTGPKFWSGRYNIGVWFWEAEDFPALFHPAFTYVDEVWVASEFIRQTLLKVSPKAVFKFRLPVVAPKIDRSLTRADLGLPEQFIFLFSFDFLSVLERKNPLGLIQAFVKAFKPGEGPRLLIKSINGDKRILEMEKLRYAIRGRSDILPMDGYLGAIENATLTALSDCYVSLHRSEGFGLTIAEAMALGKPAIATAYSGNLEFMTQENSYLCPSRHCEVGPEREPYPATSYWSEPDLQAAAQLLRYVYDHQGEARGRGLQAAADMRSLHSAAVAGKMINARLALIRERRARPGPARSIDFLQDQIDELQNQLRREQGSRR